MTDLTDRIDALSSWLLVQLAVDERGVQAENFSGGMCEDEEGWHFSYKRVMAECEAKRQIIDLCVHMLWEHDGGPDVVADTTLRLLALPYSDRDGYREEWAP